MPSIDLSRYQPKPKMPTETVHRSDLPALLDYEISFGRKALGDKRKESFYLELSSLLQAGIDLKSSIDLIAADEKKKIQRMLFKSIGAYVIGGMSFSQALNTTGRFSLYEIYSIQIGEETGKIIEILQDLAKYYQNKIKQRRKIVSALTYPSIVLLTSLGAVVFMLKFIVPMFGDVFQRFGGELPWITRLIIAISGWMEKHFFIVLLLFLISGLSLYLNRKTESFRAFFSAVILHIPVAGSLVQKIYLARFCNSMRLLINAHIPLLRSITLISKMIHYYPIEASLPVIEEDILKGKSLNESLQQFKIYPPKMVMLLKVGEETNKLDYFFSKISDQYIEEVEYKTTTLSSLIEPLIIIFLGLVVGVILIAMYLPLFQMSNSF
ncbi:type II secretion system F family protein [Desertivirga xinjiangensis]|uniref:type II secretion system F family protein n=1 Tax=Desertivirga xinjiangensis TaxID=539206 RepID=UPI0021097023|nr:type II secretion system F family protein [Pedobacter xinjiangensis]